LEALAKKSYFSGKDRRFEISNLGLIKNMAESAELAEVL
jgi:hypothetical protein